MIFTDKTVKLDYGLAVLSRGAMVLNTVHRHNQPPLLLLAEELFHLRPDQPIVQSWTVAAYFGPDILPQLDNVALCLRPPTADAV